MMRNARTMTNVKTRKNNYIPLFCSIITVMLGIIIISSTCDENNNTCLFYEKKNAIVYDVFVENKKCTICSRINPDNYINNYNTNLLRSQNDNKNCENIVTLDCYNIYLIADLISDECAVKVMTGELFLENALNRTYDLIEFGKSIVVYHNYYTNYHIKDEMDDVKFLACYFPKDVYKNQEIIYFCTYALCFGLTMLTTLCYLFDFKKKTRGH